MEQNFLRNHWYIATPAKFRSPLALKILDEDIVVFRDNSGKIGALQDLCPHRNVQLSLGKVTTKGLECCYHGWTFDTEGKCCFIPSLRQEDKIPPKSCVKTYPVVEQDGFVWVFMGEEIPQSSPFSMPHYQEKGWQNIRFSSIVPNSVLNVVENFVDCPHTGYIHGGLFRTPASHEAKNTIHYYHDRVEIDIEEDTQKGESIFAKLLVGSNKVTHRDSFFLPSIVQVSYSFGEKWHITGVQACVPIAPFLTKVHVYVTWKLGMLTYLAKPFIPIVGRFVLYQDLAILKNQGLQLQKYGQNFCSVPADAGNNCIQQLYKKAQKGTPEEQSAVKKKEVSFRL